MTNSATFADVLVALERQYPTYETDLSIRAEIQNLPVLPNNPKPGRVSELLADLDHWAGRLTPGSYSSNDLLFWLVAKLPGELWDECRSTAERKASDAFGGRATSKLPFACTTSNPQTHEIQDFLSNSGLSKEFWDPCLGHDTIWRPGQEMKVYVDNNKHVDK